MCPPLWSGWHLTGLERAGQGFARLSGEFIDEAQLAPQITRSTPRAAFKAARAAGLPDVKRLVLSSI
jgi:hypothetical protein